MNINPTDLLAQLAASNASMISQNDGAVDPAMLGSTGLADSVVGAGKPAGGFESLLTGFIGDVNQKQLAADKAVEALAAGETDNVHDVVLTAVKANLSVRMLFEIRNQLVQAYQEVMRMQL